MDKDSSKKYSIIIVILLIVTAGLLYLEFENERQSDSPSFFTSVVKTLVSPGTITPEILAETSMKDKTIKTLQRTGTFFDPYLTLPNNITAAQYTIENTSILIYEIQSQNSSRIARDLSAQESPDFKFNTINKNAFYLNQTPAHTKTHNYLAIVINQILYGFQYKPIEHQKILEIIDALNKTE